MQDRCRGPAHATYGEEDQGLALLARWTWSWRCFGGFRGPSGRGDRLLNLESALAALALRALRRHAACHKALKVVALAQYNLYLPLGQRAGGAVQGSFITDQKSCPNPCTSKQLVSPSPDLQLTAAPLS